MVTCTVHGKPWRSGEKFGVEVKEIPAGQQVELTLLDSTDNAVSGPLIAARPQLSREDARTALKTLYPGASSAEIEAATSGWLSLFTSDAPDPEAIRAYILLMQPDATDEQIKLFSQIIAGMRSSVGPSVAMTIPADATHGAEYRIRCRILDAAGVELERLLLPDLIQIDNTPRLDLGSLTRELVFGETVFGLKALPVAISGPPVGALQGALVWRHDGLEERQILDPAAAEQARLPQPNSFTWELDVPNTRHNQTVRLEATWTPISGGAAITAHTDDRLVRFYTPPPPPPPLPELPPNEPMLALMHTSLGADGSLIVFLDQSGLTRLSCAIERIEPFERWELPPLEAPLGPRGRSAGFVNLSRPPGLHPGDRFKVRASGVGWDGRTLSFDCPVRRYTLAPVINTLSPTVIPGRRLPGDEVELRAQAPGAAQVRAWLVGAPMGANQEGAPKSRTRLPPITGAAWLSLLQNDTPSVVGHEPWGPVPPLSLLLPGATAAEPERAAAQTVRVFDRDADHQRPTQTGEGWMWRTLEEIPVSLDAGDVIGRFRVPDPVDRQDATVVIASEIAGYGWVLGSVPCFEVGALSDKDVLVPLRVTGGVAIKGQIPEFPEVFLPLPRPLVAAGQIWPTAQTEIVLDVPSGLRIELEYVSGADARALSTGVAPIKFTWEAPELSAFSSPELLIRARVFGPDGALWRTFEAPCKVVSAALDVISDDALRRGEPVRVMVALQPGLRGSARLWIEGRSVAAEELTGTGGWQPLTLLVPADAPWGPRPSVELTWSDPWTGSPLRRVIELPWIEG